MVASFKSFGFSAGVLIFLSLVSSCKKAGELEKKTDGDLKPTDYPVEGFAYNDGVLASIRTRNFLHTDSGEVQIPGNYVAAFFYSENSAGPFLEAGSVSIDTVDLEANSNTVYEVPFGPSYPFGYASGDTVNWSVGGSAENEINPMAVTLIGYPGQPFIDTTIFSIKKGVPFKLKMLDTLNNTEPTANTTVYTVFTIKQGTITASHKLNGSSVEYIFPEGDMAMFSEGAATIEIGAYRTRVLQAGGKKINVLNGRLSTRKVTIIK